MRGPITSWLLIAEKWSEVKLEEQHTIHPKNISGVIDLLANINGTVEPILEVEYQNKTKRIIRNDEMSENIEINIADSSIDDEVSHILFAVQEMESLNYTSEENKNIYERNLGKIIPFKK